jgi:hypothetical protein
MAYPMVFDRKRSETPGTVWQAAGTFAQVRGLKQATMGSVTSTVGGIRGLWVRVPRGLQNPGQARTGVLGPNL